MATIRPSHLNDGHRYLIPALEEVRDTGQAPVDMRPLSWPRKSSGDRLGDPGLVLGQFRSTLRACVRSAGRMLVEMHSALGEGEQLPRNGEVEQLERWLSLYAKTLHFVAGAGSHAGVQVLKVLDNPQAGDDAGGDGGHNDSGDENTGKNKS